MPHIHRTDLETAVNTVFAGMTKALKMDERIEIRGFGSFSVRRRAAKEGRNPRTGQPVLVPSRRAPVFSPGKELKARINGAAAAQDGDSNVA